MKILTANPKTQRYFLFVVLALLLGCLTGGQAKKDKKKGGGNMVVMMGSGGGGSYGGSGGYGGGAGGYGGGGGGGGGGFPMVPLPMPMPMPMFCGSAGYGKKGGTTGGAKGTKEKIVIIPIPAQMLMGHGQSGPTQGGSGAYGSAGGPLGDGYAGSIPMMVMGYGSGETPPPMGYRGGGNVGGYGAASQEYSYELSPMASDHFTGSNHQLSLISDNEGLQIGESTHESPIQNRAAQYQGPAATLTAVGNNQLQAHFRLPDRRR